ncbi:sugar kinase [Amycolatopsis taiwanensis]|uniref:2-dehydro-3-deoxygluconokinase n=1 Tax=Amycolatopsis taiwanensis TaxID=342230 RepID=A0A9W6VLK8_9PSEU|nr:sugar kinase [Amycolatopsis taiwanensis]GLY71572.1 2-dehydro-3-deoxygluconokinase [Amycolatopsis taiwanensis]
MNSRPLVVTIGECMLELVRRDDGLLRPGYAGDTFNTAVYLKRGAPKAQVAFASAIGGDDLSDGLARAAADEALRTDLLWRHPTRTIGLYLVHTDSHGERSFTYYRDRSAARDCFTAAYPRHIDDAIASADLAYLSGITLSTLTADARTRLLNALRRTRDSHGHIAFDLNYRPRGWDNPAAARNAVASFLPWVTIALTSAEDELALWGDTVDETIDRYRRTGAEEVVVKHGPGDTVLATADQVRRFPVRRVGQPLDTTGAGDSFNGAYLAARLNGEPPDKAVHTAARCAAEVIMVPGAIVPRHHTATA